MDRVHIQIHQKKSILDHRSTTKQLDRLRDRFGFQQTRKTTLFGRHLGTDSLRIA